MAFVNSFVGDRSMQMKLLVSAKASGIQQEYSARIGSWEGQDTGCYGDYYLYQSPTNIVLNVATT